MKNIILKKENGILLKTTRDSSDDETFYNFYLSNCFDSEIDRTKLLNFTQKQVEMISKAVCIVVDELEKNGSIKDLSTAMDTMKFATTKQELIDMVLLLTDKFVEFIDLDAKRRPTMLSQEFTSKTIKYALDTMPDLVITIAIKKIMTTYYLNKVMSLKKSKLTEMEFLKLNNYASTDLLNYLGEDFPWEFRSNGVCELAGKILFGAVDAVYDQTQIHLCWENCANASPVTCPKVHDRIKKSIDKYDYIVSGYQVLNKDGFVDKFVVTKCNNYVEEKPKTVTAEEREKARIAKETLKTIYFDADSIDDAHVIQRELVDKGQLTDVRGRMPSNDEILRIRRRNEK